MEVYKVGCRGASQLGGFTSRDPTKGITWCLKRAVMLLLEKCNDNKMVKLPGHLYVANKKKLG